MGGKKGKKGEKKESETVRESDFKPQLMPTERDSFVMVDFKLLNWKYMNFKMKFRDTTHIFTIKKLLRERHGRMEDLKVCINAFTESNEIRNEMLTLKECGCEGKTPDVIVGPSGIPSFDESTLPVYQLFYDFKPSDFSDPVLLFFK